MARIPEPQARTVVAEATGAAATGSRTVGARDIEAAMAEAGEQARLKGEADPARIRAAKLAARDKLLNRI